jgi:prevent-host-death family protein
MKSISATDAKTRLGQYLEQVNIEPVQIQKKERPVAVLISYDEYERLAALENAYWLAQAKKGEKSGYIGVEKSMKLLRRGLGEKP